MKKALLSIQIALIFIGSIVGAGVCSGRELNQFFASYGTVGFVGIATCGILYVVFGIMIVQIANKYNVSSYDEFVELVCPKWVADFINLVLTLFLFSSTSIILAGSGSIINQYFGIPKWMGALIMVGLSSIFLLRNTSGLFEVNNVVVPTLMIVMSSIFISYIVQNPQVATKTYIYLVPRQKTGIALSTLLYVSFNILTIIGVIVPLTSQIKKPGEIIKGVALGSLLLTILGMMIAFIMLVNPEYPYAYEIPLLAVAMHLSRILQIAMLGIMWLEMFSSQVSNVYSLSYYLKNRFNIDYTKGIFITVIIAAPFSVIGFSKLVEFLYPMFGALSLLFLFFCAKFIYDNKISLSIEQTATVEGEIDPKTMTVAEVTAANDSNQAPAGKSDKEIKYHKEKNYHTGHNNQTPAGHNPLDDVSIHKKHDNKSKQAPNNTDLNSNDTNDKVANSQDTNGNDVDNNNMESKNSDSPNADNADSKSSKAKLSPSAYLHKKSSSSTDEINNAKNNIKGQKAPLMSVSRVKR